MDPDKALEACRKATQQVHAAQDADEEHEAASALAEAFSALDDWLTRGGYRPRAWTEGRS